MTTTLNRWALRAAALWMTLAGAGCGDDGPAGPVTVDAGPARSVGACESVRLDPSVTGRPRALRWELAAGASPILGFETEAGGGVVFRAPSVVVPTVLALRLVAEDRDGQLVSDTVDVQVEPAPRLAGLAAGMAPDCAPFVHGVASGDPRPDGIVLWTRFTPETDPGPAEIEWELAEEPGFAEPVASGRAPTDRARDWTVKVDVGGLAPGRTLYYRFRAPDGRLSVVGRTRTAPQGPVERLRFAVASCSSIYSGLFNAYRRMAERADLDLVLHVGDYLYDFVDENEQVRVPDPYPEEPGDLTGWRGRHGYYLHDPDLRAARAMHPWMLLWDNHDVERNARPDFHGSVQAFREWNPIRDQDPARPEILYRRQAFGDLVDVVLMDTLLFRDRELVPGTAGQSMLGNEQYAWLAAELSASSTAWRVLGSQKVMGTVRVNPDLVEAFDGDRREIFDPGSWDGYPEERTRVFDLLASGRISDNLVVSGDSHISVAMDLTDRPGDPTSPAVGVELLPTSISRGNFDEQLGLGTPKSIFDFLVRDTMARNPHHRYLEITRHGYGILDLTPERVVGQIWYSPILERSDVEELGVSLTTRRGEDHWRLDEGSGAGSAR